MGEAAEEMDRCDQSLVSVSVETPKAAGLNIHVAQQPHAAIWITIKCTRPTLIENSSPAVVRFKLMVPSLMRDVKRHADALS
jgi:hypothetical protein